MDDEPNLLDFKTLLAVDCSIAAAGLASPSIRWRIAHFDVRHLEVLIVWLCEGGFADISDGVEVLADVLRCRCS